jgi:lipopolysaccharide biosynthesis glycosyltransferase
LGLLETIMSSRPGSARCHDVVVVSAADNSYAMPLAVTIRSALDHLHSDRRMQLFILDGGLSEHNKTRLLKSWMDPRLQVHWIQPNIADVQDLPVSAHVNRVSYFRLLMPLLLPEHVTRAVYLDADMLVRHDLGDLWNEDQGEHAVLAVQDIAAPMLDSEAALPAYGRCRYYLASARPIANYRELRLAATTKYFNGGLLVADLAKWRRMRLSEQMLKCLRENRQHVLWWDQYALNVMLAGDWRELDHRWNQGAHIYAYPNWRESPLDRQTFAQLRTSPWIVHFCSPSKPWHYFCRHPFKEEFRHYVGLTDWNGWQPERPKEFLRRWWGHHYKPLRGKVQARWRAVKLALSPKRRRAA